MRGVSEELARCDEWEIVAWPFAEMNLISSQVDLFSVSAKTTWHQKKVQGVFAKSGLPGEGRAEKSQQCPRDGVALDRSSPKTKGGGVLVGGKWEDGGR